MTTPPSPCCDDPAPTEHIRDGSWYCANCDEDLDSPPTFELSPAEAAWIHLVLNNRGEANDEKFTELRFRLKNFVEEES